MIQTGNTHKLGQDSTGTSGKLHKVPILKMIQLPASAAWLGGKLLLSLRAAKGLL